MIGARALRIGFTGTREGMTREQLRVVPAVLEALACEVLPLVVVAAGEEISVVGHHGDAFGSDAQFHDITRGEFPRSWIVVHPPTDERQRAFKQADEFRRPYRFLTRDHHIVDESEVLVATPRGLEEEMFSGTWATVRYSVRKVRRPTVIVYPDGSADRFHFPEMDDAYVPRAFDLEAARPPLFALYAGAS